MGWQNYHLYEFRIHGYQIGMPLNEADDFFFDSDKIIDATEISLGSVLSETKEKFTYEYDFGDGWKHTIIAEKFLPADPAIRYPTCVGGKLKCPPEDCGGVYGYYHLLEVLSNRRHPERKDMLEWLGGPIDPSYFNLDEVNGLLKKIKL